jgi:hypothetical protein
LAVAWMAKSSTSLSGFELNNSVRRQQLVLGCRVDGQFMMYEYQSFYDSAVLVDACF